MSTPPLSILISKTARYITYPRLFIKANRLLLIYQALALSNHRYETSNKRCSKYMRRDAAKYHKQELYYPRISEYMLKNERDPNRD